MRMTTTTTCPELKRQLILCGRGIHWKEKMFMAVALYGFLSRPRLEEEPFDASRCEVAVSKGGPTTQVAKREQSDTRCECSLMEKEATRHLLRW